MNGRSHDTKNASYSNGQATTDRAKLSVAKTYYQLTKPGIIYGNCLSAAAGFFVASQRQPDWRLLVICLAGIGLVIATGCVLNNYMDRAIDSTMVRTRNRALVRGDIAPRNALVFAAGLFVSGFSLLAWYTNPLTVYIGLFGLLVYLIAYGVTKRRAAFGTIVGSIAGATPVLAGYTSVSGSLNITGGLLFLALAVWQMPHFYAIAMFRLDDYQAAGIPVLPATKGTLHTKYQIMAYIIGLGVCSILLAYYGNAGYSFMLGMLVLVGAWLQKGVIGFHTKDDVVWARQMFRFSLLVLLGFCGLLAISPWLA